MKNLLMIGRVVFALPLIAFGLMHLAKSEDMAGMVLADWPMAQGLVIVSGVGLLLGGVSIIWGKMAKIACILVALLMLVFIISLHMPNAMGDDEMMKQMGMISTLKDLGIMGGALVLAAVFAEKQPKVA